MDKDNEQTGYRRQLKLNVSISLIYKKYIYVVRLYFNISTSKEPKSPHFKYVKYQ